MFNFRGMSLEDARTYYRQQARIHHPDFGGKLETMQELNSEYARYMTDYARSNAYTRQTQAHNEGKKSAADYNDVEGLAGDIFETLKAVLNACRGYDIDVELCGLWLWVTGETKPVKEILKANGFKFSGQKVAWYKAFVPSFSRGRVSLETIREMYGSTKFKAGQEEEEKGQRRPSGALGGAA